jgi:NADPH:quinone reductase-like Zn-dependent oxidoreductase
VITSSSDEKLLRAKALGAAAIINYKSTPEWSKAMLAATNGVGAHHILEVGGSGTLAQSLACVAPGGNVALIGGLSGFGGDIPAVSLIGRNASVTGIFVGSRADFEAMLQFMTQHAIRPVIDRRFAFDDAAAAYDYMDTGNHFGKLVIDV